MPFPTKYQIQAAGVGFDRTYAIQKLPMRQRYAAHGSAFVNLCTLARLLSEDEIAAQIWEAL